MKDFLNRNKVRTWCWKRINWEYMQLKSMVLRFAIVRLFQVDGTVAQVQYQSNLGNGIKKFLDSAWPTCETMLDFCFENMIGMCTDKLSNCHQHFCCALIAVLKFTMRMSNRTYVGWCSFFLMIKQVVMSALENIMKARLWSCDMWTGSPGSKIVIKIKLTNRLTVLALIAGWQVVPK